ncbi:unnamed protein product [Parascedosporium putredinis]|uniref:Protein SDA1 n=1 Tax=Parascedosporium putredinis TaxID=1442378 RepID=A0A9P1H7K5_9PEZI|nr:unnamed protein product [Parascedosporium putredinis]CAI7999767.1 unnamed protein product [Parascedosporium putredinis]
MAAVRIAKGDFPRLPSTATSESVESFHNIIDLIAHVADCYIEETKTFPEDLKTILAQHHAILHPDLREKIVGSLVLLRRKDVIDSASLLTNLFPILVSSNSKSLRALLFQKITMDLRNSNSKTINHPLNRTVQTVLYNLVSGDRQSSQALWAVKLTRELWKRQLWTDAKPVDVMKEACLSDNEKVVTGAVRFFLGGDKEREDLEDDSSDEETIDLKRVQHQLGINKKTRKKAKALDRAKDKIHRQEKKKHAAHPSTFPPFTSSTTPRRLARLSFQAPTKYQGQAQPRHEAARPAARHPPRRSAQAHPHLPLLLVPQVPHPQAAVRYLYPCLPRPGNPQPRAPESVEPLLQKIANEFVSEGSAGEVAAAGLNAIREVCVRQPLAMSETLLQDLVQYRKSKDKGVMMAAKGLLSLYREVGAELLRKKDRGKDATIGLKTGDLRHRKFGEEEASGIEGLELLVKWKEEQKKKKEEERALKGEGAKKEGEDEDGYNSSDWEVESVDSDDSGGWIDVEHSDDEQAPAPKKRKTGDDADAEEDKENDEALDLAAISKLATTTILTPADLAKLQELRIEASLKKEVQGVRTQRQREREARHIDEGLTAEQIELPAKLRKTTKEERIAMAKEGKPGREEHKSTQAIRREKKNSEGKSTTNKEKSKKKNFMMTLGKAKFKQKRSLVDTQRVLRKHIDRSKRGGRGSNQN